MVQLNAANQIEKNGNQSYKYPLMKNLDLLSSTVAMPEPLLQKIERFGSQPFRGRGLSVDLADRVRCPGFGGVD